MAQETRKGKRAPAALRVRFRASTVDEFIKQQAPNISSGGMFIKSKSPLARGTLMVDALPASGRLSPHQGRGPRGVGQEASPG